MKRILDTHTRLTIAALRCISSTLVWQATGRELLSTPLVAMMLHLSIGDTWNTINNVESRYLVLLRTCSAYTACIYCMHANLCGAFYVTRRASLRTSKHGCFAENVCVTRYI
jgi:tryptophan-rich sensory protein